MQMHVTKALLEIHFIYVGNKEIYCIFKTSCIISVLFTKYSWLHKFVFYLFIFFLGSNITYFQKQSAKILYSNQLNKGYESYQDAVVSNVCE
jgi:hypothetical protein